MPLLTGGWVVDLGAAFPTWVADGATAAACLGVPPQSSAGVGTVRPAPADPNVPAAVGIGCQSVDLPQSAAAGAQRGEAEVAPSHTPGSGASPASASPNTHPPVCAGEADVPARPATPPVVAGEAPTGSYRRSGQAASFVPGNE